MMLRKRRLTSLVLAAPVAFLAAGCLGYAPPGTVNTPGAPGESTETRLPQLLQQLQGAGAGLELFDATPSSQVLAAQDTDGGKDNSTTPPGTVTGTQSPTSIAQVPASTSAPSTPSGSSTPGATATPNGAVTPTSTPALTATPTPTATPTVPPEEIPPLTPPSEGSGDPPPTE